jgi:nitrous oxide reductase accessory protein NosL
MKNVLRVLLFCLFLSAVGSSVLAGPVEPVSPDQRCAVCGMMVAKYKPWITQLHAAGEEVVMFDGVKDLMAYYFNPAAYNGKGDVANAAIWVKDYYTLEYLDGRKAFYVVGSDVMGPMGEELVPFGSRQAAENFSEDHQGKQLLLFDEINAEMIMSMKKRHMMKMKKMKGANQ